MFSRLSICKIASSVGRWRFSPPQAVSLLVLNPEGMTANRQGSLDPFYWMSPLQGLFLISPHTRGLHPLLTNSILSGFKNLLSVLIRVIRSKSTSLLNGGDISAFRLKRLYLLLRNFLALA